MGLLPDQKKKEKQPLHSYPEAQAGSHFFSHYGIDSTRFNGVNALTGSIVLMASGRFVMFIDVLSGTIQSIPGPENGGVGAVAVHPSHRYFVVCERAPVDPLVRVYSWPGRVEVGAFSGGAIRGFSGCCFSADGAMMATVATEPDYALAVWDWASRRMILRSKCAGTDVYSVAFSPFNSGILVTGGEGHIKFWTMAKTFTGMKLQGLLGKFGRLEISNISGFVVFADGKILSGSEEGLILLWEGDLVRCCFARALHREDETAATDALLAQCLEYTPCHDGKINVVQLLEGAQVVLTAGDDGYMRYWRVTELESAEGEGAPPLYAPECLFEYLVDPDARIRAVTLCADTNEWVLLDSSGAIWRVPYSNPHSILEANNEASISALNAVDSFPREIPAMSKLTRDITPAVAALRFNGGAVTSATLSPCEHTVVTGGEDGTIRLVDYISSREVYQLRLSQASVVSDIRFIRRDSTGKTLLAFAENGTVLLLRRDVSSFVALGQWRPHREGLLTTAMDDAERRLCTISSDGTAFFFNIMEDLSALEPIGFCTLPLTDASCVAWDDATGTVLVGYQCGRLLAVKALTLKDVNHHAGFEAKCHFALVGLRQRKCRERPVDARSANAERGDTDIALDEEEEEEEEEDVGPWPIHCVVPLPDGSFVIGSGGCELLYQYTTRIRYNGVTDLPPLPATGIEPPDYVEEPMINLCYRDCTPTAANLSYSRRLLVIRCQGALTLLREVNSNGHFSHAVSIAAASHDRTADHVAVAVASFDDTMLVSVAADGLVVAQKIDFPKPSTIPSMTPESMAKTQSVAAPPPPPPPPLHATESCAPTEKISVVPLSIQEQKEEDDRRRADEAKQRELDVFLAKLNVLHVRYSAILNENAAAPPSAALLSDELVLHPLIKAELDAERAKRVAEARGETALTVAREEARTRKMRLRFVDNLLFDRFLVHSFSQDFSVASFRTADPTGAIERFRAKIVELASDDDEDPEDEAGAAKGKACSEADQGVNSDGRGHLNGKGDGMNAEAGSDTGVLASGLPDENGHPALTSTMRQYFDKMDERRAERARRREGHASLLSRCPDPAAEAAELDREVKDAISTRGECILRTDAAYRAAFQRPSATAKLHQLIALEERLVRMRSGFNVRLTTMRDEKAALCKKLNKTLRRIRAINSTLRDETNTGEEDLSLTPEEQPEKRFEINRAGLDAYAVARERERARLELAKKAARGFGADLAGEQNADSKEKEKDREGIVMSRRTSPIADGGSISVGGSHSRPRFGRSSNSVPLRGSRTTSAGQSAAAIRERMDQEVRQRLDNVRLTEAEEEAAQVERERLVAERSRLRLQLAKRTSAFDAQLFTLYNDRVAVDADLCLAHARALLLFREYQMLLVFRQRERELRQRLHAARGARDALRRELTEMQGTTREQSVSLDRLQADTRVSRHEAEAFIAANFPAEHVTYVTRVFLRQVKRRTGMGDAADDDDDITSDDEDEDESGNAANEDDIGEEVCPPGCAEDHWREVLERREHRLDLSDAAAALRRRQEATQRRIDAHATSATEHDEAVAVAQRELLAFHGERRQRLNELDTLVALRCGQVRCLHPDGSYPVSLRRDDAIVISDAVVFGLRQRIEQMAEEKCACRLTLRGMGSDLTQHQRERTVWRERHAQWEERIYDAMLLKFGQIVDLEQLESSSGCREVEELRERLRAEELRWEAQLRLCDRRIVALRSELQGGLTNNTHLLHDLGDQEADRQEVELSLAQATQKVVSKIYDGTSVATAADRKNLRLLVEAQQEEIEALRAEAAMLRRKGGHVYAPAGPFPTTSKINH